MALTLDTSTIKSTFTDQDNPIRVVIENKGNHKWDEDIHPDCERQMRDRLKVLDGQYKGHWKDRKGQPEGPRYTRIDHPGHLPVTALADEHVRFECKKRFMIVLSADSDVPFANGAPMNPVVDANPEWPFVGFSRLDDKLGTNVVRVKVSSNAGAQQQIFYKMMFIVLDDDGPKFVDPDFDTP